MKITNIGLYSSSEEPIALLSFRDPTSQNSYVAKNITGLDADEISAKFYGKGATSKKRYYSLALVKREIAIKIGLFPKWEAGETPSTLRDRLYKAVSASRTGMIRLAFNDGLTPVSEIEGFVTKMEADIFSENPDVTITIMPEDPLIKGVAEVSIDVGDFPADRPSIVDLKSTSPHGFKFVATFSGPVTQFTITEVGSTDWSFRVNPGTIGLITGFQNLDKLYYSSERNNRYLYMVRDGNTTHLMDKVQPNSIWPIIFPGDNHFETNVPSFLSWDSITYYPAYWGV